MNQGGEVSAEAIPIPDGHALRAPIKNCLEEYLKLLMLSLIKLYFTL